MAVAASPGVAEGGAWTPSRDAFRCPPKPTACGRAKCALLALAAPPSAPAQVSVCEDGLAATTSALAAALDDLEVYHEVRAV